MRWKRLFIPFFLAPIDRYLRNNLPVIWRTRIHIILFITLLPLNLFFYLLGHSTDVDLTLFPTYTTLLLYTLGFLVVMLVLFLFWGEDQRRIPLQKRNYWLTTTVYWLCILSFGFSFLFFVTPIIQKTADLLPQEEVDQAYRIVEQWEQCRGCNCPETTYNRASTSDKAFMLQLSEQMGFDTLTEQSCSWSDSNRVYMQVRDTYVSKSKNFYRRVVSLYEAQAFMRQEGTYFNFFYRLFPLGLLLFGWLAAQWLYFRSLRGNRPLRDPWEVFTRRDLLDLWIINRIDNYLLRNHPWWWNVQLHRWLFYVLFWGNALLLILIFSLPLRLGHLVDDLVPFSLILLLWVLGGIGWFVGWAYQRSTQVATRKNPWKNLLLVLGYLLGFYAILFNVGVFSFALAYRLDRLLPSEQLLTDMQYRLGSPEAYLFDWKTAEGDEDYYYVNSSYSWTWTQRLSRLKNIAINSLEAMNSPDTDSLNQLLLKYANQLIPSGQLTFIPNIPPGDTSLSYRIPALLDSLDRIGWATPDHVIDSVISVRSYPVEQELINLQSMLKGITGNTVLGQACLTWQLNSLKVQKEQIQEELKFTYSSLSGIDSFIETTLSETMDSLRQIDPIKAEQLKDTLFHYRRQYLDIIGLPDLPIGISLDDFITYTPQADHYLSLDRAVERLEAAQTVGGYKALNHQEQRQLIQDRIRYLEEELQKIVNNRYAIGHEIQSDRRDPIEGEMQWLEGLKGPDDYFNHSLFLFINRLQEDAMVQQLPTSDILTEVEVQAAQLASLNKKRLDEWMFEKPVDPCRELEKWQQPQESPSQQEIALSKEMEDWDLSCRYLLKEDSRVAQLSTWLVKRLFDIDLRFHYASKLIPAWAATLEAKNLRQQQGIVYNLLTLYIPVYALPFILTYIFIVFAFYYFHPATVGLITLGTLFFFIFLSILPNRFFLEDPIWTYLVVGGAITGYAFFYPTNHRIMNSVTLAWFVCTPLFMAVFSTDRWMDVLLRQAEIDSFSLQTTPAMPLWMATFGYLLLNLLIVLIVVKIFTRRAYSPH